MIIARVKARRPTVTSADFALLAKSSALYRVGNKAEWREL